MSTKLSDGSQTTDYHQRTVQSNIRIFDSRSAEGISDGLGWKSSLKIDRIFSKYFATSPNYLTTYSDRFRALLKHIYTMLGHPYVCNSREKRLNTKVRCAGGSTKYTHNYQATSLREDDWTSEKFKTRPREKSRPTRRGSRGVATNRDRKSERRRVLDALGESVPCVKYDSFMAYVPEGEFLSQIGPTEEFYKQDLAQYAGPEAVREWKTLLDAILPLSEAAMALPLLSIRGDLGVLSTAALRYAPSLLKSFAQMGPKGALGATKLLRPFSEIVDSLGLKDPFIRNWIDLLVFLLAGVKSDGILSAEMIYMFAEWYKPGCSLEYPVKGSGEIVDALVRGLQKFGGHLSLRSHVKNIVIENGRATGVNLRSGQAVVSNASMWDTLNLLPKEAVPDSYKRGIESTPQCKSFMHLHLGFDAEGIREDLGIHHIVVNDWNRGVDADQNVVLISVPSVLSPHVAPRGKHILHAYTPGTEPYELWADVDGWLSQVESLFYRHQTTSEQKLAVGTLYLAGDALEWYRQWYWDMRRSWRSLTWDNFAADLRCRFWSEILTRRSMILESMSKTCEGIIQLLTEMKNENSVYMSNLSKLMSQVIANVEELDPNSENITKKDIVADSAAHLLDGSIGLMKTFAGCKKDEMQVSSVKPPLHLVIHAKVPSKQTSIDYSSNLLLKTDGFYAILELKSPFNALDNTMSTCSPSACGIVNTSISSYIAISWNLFTSQCDFSWFEKAKLKGFGSDRPPPLPPDITRDPITYMGLLMEMSDHINWYLRLDDFTIRTIWRFSDHSLQPANLSSKENQKPPNMLQFDGRPPPLGLEAARGEMIVLILWNSATKKKQMFSTDADIQLAVLVQAYECERIGTRDIEMLGKFKLSKIPHAPERAPPITVCIRGLHVALFDVQSMQSLVLNGIVLPMSLSFDIWKVTNLQNLKFSWGRVWLDYKSQDMTVIRFEELFLAFNNLVKFCIKGVRQKAPEVLIFALPPSKPPDGFFPSKELFSNLPPNMKVIFVRPPAKPPPMFIDGHLRGNRYKRKFVVIVGHFHVKCDSPPISPLVSSYNGPSCPGMWMYALENIFVAIVKGTFPGLLGIHTRHEWESNRHEYYKAINLIFGEGLLEQLCGRVVYCLLADISNDMKFGSIFLLQRVVMNQSFSLVSKQNEVKMRLKAALLLMGYVTKSPWCREISDSIDDSHFFEVIGMEDVHLEILLHPLCHHVQALLTIAKVKLARKCGKVNDRKINTENKRKKTYSGCCVIGKSSGRILKNQQEYYRFQTKAYKVVPKSREISDCELWDCGLCEGKGSIYSKGGGEDVVRSEDTWQEAMEGSKAAGDES
ncbi:unnamed protein product [Rhodiola kirilowii]